MSQKRTSRRSKKLKPKKNGIECHGISGGNSCTSSEETLYNHHTTTTKATTETTPTPTLQTATPTDTPPLDRHGFVKTHVLHKQVSSAHAHTDGRELTMKREAKWLDMLSRWPETLKHRDKLKSRCQKGIPQAVRAHTWQKLAGSDILKERNPGVYERLTRVGETTDQSEWDHVIRKDIPRTFRHHSMFYENNSRGQEDLFNVLLAYTRYDVETGYNQALAPVAAVLLMHMPPEDSFWCLVSICVNYLPGYYGRGMEAVRLDCMTFAHLLQTHCPHIHSHLEEQQVETSLYLVEWLVCVFSRSVPFDTVLRIWDMFFCQGYKVRISQSDGNNIYAIFQTLSRSDISG